MSALLADFSTEVRHRLDDLDPQVRAGGLDPGHRPDRVLIAARGRSPGAFGTGHSQPFAMKINSANIPGGDAHNEALKSRYGEHIAGLA